MLEVKRDDKHGAGIRLLLRGKVQAGRGLHLLTGHLQGLVGSRWCSTGITPIRTNAGYAFLTNDDTIPPHDQKRLESRGG